MTPRGTILVCDDEAPIRQVIALKLRAAGFEVVEARNGQEGLDAVVGEQSIRPCVILTDLQMPLLSGIEMCKALRKHQSTHSTPVLMLTGRGYILTPEEVQQTNIRQVIHKPFGVRQLVERVILLAGSPPASQVA
jgi:DNA-binding response OmpR family regulator